MKDLEHFRRVFEEIGEGECKELVDCLDKMGLIAGLRDGFLYIIFDDVAGSPTYGAIIWVSVRRYGPKEEFEVKLFGPAMSPEESARGQILKESSLLQVSVGRQTMERILSGSLDPVLAGMTGQAKVTGDFKFLMRYPASIQAFFKELGKLYRACAKTP